MNRRIWIALWAITLSGGGCNASYPTTPTTSAPVVALQVHFDSPTGDLNVGSRVALRAWAVTSETVYQDVTSKTSWYSSDPTVIRAAVPGLSSSQLAVGPGTAQIVGAFEGFTAGVTLAVRPPGTRPRPYLEFAIHGDPRAVTGESLSRLLFWDNAGTTDITASATWASSNTAVATVDKGLVKGVGPGTTEINASYNGLSTRYALSVWPRGF